MSSAATRSADAAPPTSPTSPGSPGSPGSPQRFTLHPGHVVVAERGDRLETLLGSCVAIILTDPRRTVAAMCHVVHARLPDHGRDDANTAYGAAALDAMARRLRQRGIAPQLCEAFVFGGGNMFPSLVGDAHVGQHNGQWALDALRRLSARVVQQDLGGATYRRVGWTVGTGLPEVVAVQV